MIFHRYACQFLDASRCVPTDGTYSPVPYYLVCHALELGLKAFSMAKGETTECVKDKLRHNLKKALKRARKYGLDGIIIFSAEEQGELRKANKYYNSKGFEYLTLKSEWHFLKL